MFVVGFLFKSEICDLCKCNAGGTFLKNQSCAFGLAYCTSASCIPELKRLGMVPHSESVISYSSYHLMKLKFNNKTEHTSEIEIIWIWKLFILSDVGIFW